MSESLIKDVWWLDVRLIRPQDNPAKQDVNHMATGHILNCSACIPSCWEEWISQSQLPHIWLNRNLDHNAVYFDDRQGGRDATEHLLKLGHRNISYVDWTYQNPQQHYSKHERYQGYYNAMQQAGLNATLLELGQDTASTHTQMLTLHQFLRTNSETTALITYSNSVAVQVYLVAAQMNLSIPSDLSLITYGPPGGFPVTPIDYYMQDWKELGATAGMLLGQNIQDQNKTFVSQTVPFRFQGMGTTSFPPSTKT